MKTKSIPKTLSRTTSPSAVLNILKKMQTKIFLYLAVTFIIGVIIGVGAYFLTTHQSPCPQYEYINSGFACNGAPIISKGGYIVLQENISQYIQQQSTAGAVSNIAVYFRDLSGGPSLGINDDETFIPASLLKLPVIMSIFQLEEQQPGFIKTLLNYSTSSIAVPVPQGIDTPDVPGMLFGQQYTLEQLMASTIINSDNLAYYLLIGYMNQSVPGGGSNIDRTLTELGIVDPKNVDQQSISVAQYASLFRLLYNVSFLSPAHSEKLLSWLSRSTFNDGLQAGVPSGITVADKWGLRSLPDGTQELHDCGIIYYPQNPYILCVMTEGKNQTQLAGIIASISKMVYTEVDSRKSNGH